MKFVEPRPYADPDVAARKIVELANAFEPVQDGRIYIEKINGPFLFEIERQPGRIQGWARSRHRTRLARPARKRHLCEVHRGRRGAVRLKQASPMRTTAVARIDFAISTHLTRD
jgi:hypothetical protein